MEHELSDALTHSAAGEFDGDEYGAGICTIYIYGTSAERLFTVTLPILKKFRAPAGSYVVKRYGGPGAQEERVELDGELESALTHAQAVPPETTDIGKNDIARPFKVGGKVKPPRVRSAPSPDYPEEFRRLRLHGTCMLQLILDKQGLPHNVQVKRSTGIKALDEKALEAVRQWRFDPAMKDGQPVPVQIDVKVAFRVY